MRDFKWGTGRSRRQELMLTAVLAAMLFLVIAIAAPGSARATYVVRECAASQTTAPDPYLISAGTFDIGFSNECSSGSNYGLRLDAHGKTSPGGTLVWQVSAPSGTVFKTAEADVHYGTDDGYGPAVALPNQSYGPLSGGSGPSQWAHALQNNTDHFGIWLRCWKTDAWCNSTWAYAWSNNIAFEIADLAPPSVTASGELFAGGPVHGVQNIATTAADNGGGVRSIVIYVNGVTSSMNEICPTDGTGAYQRVKPCPGSTGQQVASLDTERGPGWVNGPNDVRICSYDAGGNESSPCFHQVVEVDNSCPASGSQQAAQLDAGADQDGRLRSQLTVRSTDTPVVRGTLTASQGDPVPGATVCLYQTVALADASRQLVATATTQANGRFASRLDPGASRKIDVVYRFNTRTLQQRVGIDSAVVPTLSLGEKSVTNGSPVHFKGGIPGPNADGRAIALQARVGRKWRTFKQLRTDSDGRFRGLYRFTQTAGSVRYTFRATVKQQSGYPFEPGASHRRRILVRG
jgi:5-hydroxyisourate hydrolase-like protein (transthyretin family)